MSTKKNKSLHRPRSNRKRQDIIRRQLEQLKLLAYFDHKLQLGNDLKLEKDISATGDRKASLICFDVASLRKINDVYGWDIGDELLLSIKNWILNLNIPNSSLYRISGDRFCLTVSGWDEALVNHLADELHSRFDEPWFLHKAKNKLYIFCNIFMGVIPSKHVHGDMRLLPRIERTLDLSKKDSGIIFYNETTDKEFNENFKLELSLKNCVRDGMMGFEVYYQPIVNPLTASWCGLEALCRWNSPEYGSVTPSVFIPEAERQGLIPIIGEWVLETAISVCKRLGLDTYDNFILSVNLSTIQFLDDQLAQRIIAILEKYNYPSEKLCLEITESYQFNLYNQSMRIIHTLIDKNILISVDDFGTGYSSFHHLKSLPAYALKTDRSFISDIEGNSYLQFLFYIMVEIAHAANMKLVAEGVETVEQMNLLVQSGADYLQGFLFAEPMPAEQLMSELNRFKNNNGYIHKTQKHRINLSKLLKRDSIVELTPYLHQLLNKCLRILFYDENTDEAINQILELTGEGMNMSRAYVYLRNHENYYVNTHTWYAKDVTLHKRLALGVKTCLLSDEWMPALLRDGIILSRDTVQSLVDLPDADDITRIEAAVVIPMWDGSTLQGFVGFDDYAHNKNWRPDEILMLHNLCTMLANLQKKRDLQQEVSFHKKTLESILNNINMGIFVMDLINNDILFANSHLKQGFGNIKSHLCWEDLIGKYGSLSCLQMGELLDHVNIKQIEREHYDSVADKHYKIYDTIIPWDDKNALLEYAVDITCLSNPAIISTRGRQ